jgi:hypothetical protein
MRASRREFLGRSVAAGAALGLDPLAPAVPPLERNTSEAIVERLAPGGMGVERGGLLVARRI